MKIDILDWVIDKLKLTTHEEIETPKSYVFHERNNSNKRVFLKRVQSYEDCQCIIEEVRNGTICLCIVSQVESIQSQMMLSYIQGAVFALKQDSTIITEIKVWKKDENNSIKLTF